MANRFVWDAQALANMRFFNSLEEMRAFDELHREEAQDNPDPMQAEPEAAPQPQPQPTSIPPGSIRRTYRLKGRQSLLHTRRGK